MIGRSLSPLLWGAVVVFSGLWAIPVQGQSADLDAPKIGDNGVVAVVAGEPITIEAFKHEMAVRGGDIPGQYATETQRKALLYEMIQDRALVARARSEGYDKDPEVVAVFERAMVTRFEHQTLNRQLDAIRVPDAEVASYYAEHRNEYSRPATFKAAIIFIAIPQTATEERRADLKTRAEQALVEAKALGSETLHFGPVARKYSDDRASRYKGGVIGSLVQHPSRQYKWDAKVVQAIFSLSKPGDIGPIVTTEEGLYLVRLVGHEGVRTRPLEQVQDGIRHRLSREKRHQMREKFLEETVAGTKVQVDGKLLESIQAPTPAEPEAVDSHPPALPAG